MPRSGKQGLTIKYGKWQEWTLYVLLGRKINIPSDVYFEFSQQFCWPSSLCPPCPPYNPFPCFPQRPGRLSKLSFWKFDKNCSSVASAFQTLWPCWKSLGPGWSLCSRDQQCGHQTTCPPQGGPWQTHGRNGQGLLTIVSQVSSNPSPAAYMSWCPSMPFLCPITSFSFISQRKDFYYQEKRLQQCLPPPGQPMYYKCWTPLFSLPLGSYYFDPHPFSRLFLLFSVLG